MDCFENNTVLVRESFNLIKAIKGNFKSDVRVMPVYDTKEFLLMAQEDWKELELKLAGYDLVSEVLDQSNESAWSKAFILREVKTGIKDDVPVVYNVPFIADLKFVKKLLKGKDFMVVNATEEPGKWWDNDEYIEMSDESVQEWTKLFPDNWL